METNTLISKCIKAEKSASSIYKDMMKQFPEYKDFWQDLFNDEIEHASFLRDVKSLNLKDEMQKIDLLPSLPTINMALELADHITGKIKSGPVSLDEALAMTLELEESMVETYTNKIIANLMSCEDKTGYKKLISDEKRHLNKVKKMIKSQ
jgi:rubrerythrin